MGLATLLQKGLWSTEEREAGVAGIIMGLTGLTEGAIPFAAADPVRVIPCIMTGSAVAAVIAMIGKVGDRAPHGGPIVLFVVDHRLAYIVALLTGTIVTAVSINLLKARSRRVTEAKEDKAA
jgi:fructose PTS system EIIBC or EIIC component